MIKLQDAYRYIAKNSEPPWDRLNACIYQELADVFLERLNAKPKTDVNSLHMENELFDFLLGHCQKYLIEIETRHGQAEVFLNHYTQSPNRGEREKHILDFAKLLGQSRRGLTADKRAFQRAFGKDAIMERYTQKVSQIEQKLSVVIQLICQTTCGETERDTLKGFCQTLIKNHIEHGLFQNLCFYKGDSRVNIAAFRTLSKVLQHCLDHEVQLTLPADLKQAIYRYAADSNQPTWSQIDALALLAHNTPEEFITIARKNLALAAPGDQLFVRARTAIQLYDLSHHNREAEPLLLAFLADPNPYVRQQMAAHLDRAAGSVIKQLFPALLCQDTCPQVRARTALAIPHLIEKGIPHHSLSETLLQQLQREDHDFALRTYLHCLPAIHMTLTHASTNPPTHKITASPQAQAQADWYKACNRILEKLLHQNSGLTLTHEQAHQWCAQAHAHLWTQHYYKEDYHYFQQRIAQAPRGKKQYLEMPSAMPETHLARVLTTVCTDQFGLDILKVQKNRLVFIKDHKKGFRFWRWWLALRTPATNKRQNYAHTRGRHYYGSCYIASDQISELSPTQVPGEPLYISDAGGYRPFLPLLEQVLSSLDQGWPTRAISLYSVWGITKILPPASLARRIWAKWQLSRHFPKIAKFRNWHAESDFNPGSFIESLEKLGFSINHLAFTDPMPEETPEAQSTKHSTWMTRKYFSTIPFFDPELRYRFTDYFFSVYQNTLLHLAYFLAIMSGFFLWQHLRWNRAISRARANIPLVIGGWGTRGKSGSERLKAALFNALGYSIFSKTTGCEAMFLHATNHGTLRELFLFRPYDKASIWEQGHVVKLAAQLNCQVFLWECMGLTPRYIHILQHQWMHDDLSTITNCYPDHEDIQGPAGVDVTEVMMKFVPRNSELITSEETMKPFLAQASWEQQSRFFTVNWLDAGLLTPDILARFPYAEHPYNIALIVEIKRGFARVQTMGGAEDDPAVRMLGQLGQMSDRLQDIGAVITAAGEAARAPVEAEKPETAEAPDLGESLGVALGPYLKTLQKNLRAIAKFTAQAAAQNAAQPTLAEAPAVSERLDGIIARLGELCEAVAQPAVAAVAAPAAAPAPQADLSPYLDQLNATLAGLATMTPSSTQIVQTLGSGVHDLLTQLARIVSDNLMPAVQGLGRRLKKAKDGAADRGLTQQLDRTLKSLDMMQDLVASLRKIDMSELTVKAVENGES